jgi:glycogen debranching enzyme
VVRVHPAVPDTAFDSRNPAIRLALAPNRYAIVGARPGIQQTIEAALSYAQPSVESVSEDPFAVAGTELTTRPRRSLKHGDTFIVLDSHGDLGGNGADGLFHGDTRFLSRLVLTLDGASPLLLGSTIYDNNTLMAVDLTNPDTYRDGHLVQPKDTLHIARQIFLWRGTAYQRLVVRNHGDHAIELRLALSFDADFADLFEVRGTARRRRGTVTRAVTDSSHVVISYQGLDNRPRRTAIAFSPEPSELTAKLAVYRLSVDPGEVTRIVQTATCETETALRPQPFLRGLRASRRDLRRVAQDATTVETGNDIFNEVLCRSMSDLCMLNTDTPQGPYPYAGIPWYSTTFGRDGIITAMQMLAFNPRIARGVLRRLAAYQAKTEDPLSDAQPGKILHEMRNGEMAALREVPFGLYYGSVDSTPLFVMLAGMYAERTGDDATIQELWPAIEAALAWIDGPGDQDRDGFVEYYRATEQGLANQGWKDSHDAIFHADGRLAEGPIALCEVQGYVFAAKRLAARCARRMGLAERASALETQAAQLATRFEQAFWCSELGTYAIALDGNKEPCRVRTSNAGQVLFSGICAFERAAEIAYDLMRPHSFSGWGVRTVGADEARYNPMSYHNGSIWPHDNALIALGCARYGLKRPVEQIFQGLFEAASYMDLRRLPELFCGFQRRRGRGPTLYPVACAPQAWAAATPFTLIEAALGLEFDRDTSQISLRNPRLPPFLGQLVLRNLRLGEASVDVMVRRHDDEVSTQLLHTSGKVEVSVTFAR